MLRPFSVLARFRVAMMRTVIVLQCALILFAVAEEEFSVRSIGRSLARCLGETGFFQCLQKEAVHNLDLLILDNSTWHYSEFVQFEKDANFTSIVDLMTGRSDISNGARIVKKLLELAEARALRLKFSPRSLDLDTNIYEGGENSRKYQKIWYLQDSLKGRKKKGKDKGMAMFGGLAMMAMMAQMFLAKVLLIAGSAFVMAKVALLVSLLTNLKPRYGSSSEHIVTYSEGGGGGHISTGGWHRSLPQYPAHYIPVHHQVGDEQHHDSPQIPDYYQYDTHNQNKDDRFL